MLKKLLLTAALFSTTFGAEIEYIDPDFSLLANRSEVLNVDTTGVVIHPNDVKKNLVHRLIKSELSALLDSTDFNVLADARRTATLEALYIEMIYIELTADSTPRNGYDKDQDAAFLSQLFWSRVSLIEQLVQAMLLSPQITTEDPTGVLQEQHEKLIAFSAKYDSNDTTPFIKGHYETLNQLMTEFRETYGYQSSTDE